MAWVIAIVWGVAVLIALVVFAFCGYELAWKSRRLTRDLGGLQQLRADVARLQGEVNAARHRAAGLRHGG